MNILIVDDHAIIRDGLRRMLATLGHEAVSEALNGREALASVKLNRPDLIILDLNLPGLGGLELIRRLLLEDRSLRILVLSMHAEPLYATRALDAGATGYLSKNASPDEIVEAVRRVARGQRYVEADVAQAIAIQGAAGSEPLDRLSARDLEILRLLASGASLAEIAQALGVGYKTVANNCTLIKTRLGLSRTADLVRFAVEMGVG